MTVIEEADLKMSQVKFKKGILEITETEADPEIDQEELNKDIIGMIVIGEEADQEIDIEKVKEGTTGMTEIEEEVNQEIATMRNHPLDMNEKADPILQSLKTIILVPIPQYLRPKMRKYQKRALKTLKS